MCACKPVLTRNTNIPPQDIGPLTKYTQYMVTGVWKVFVVVKQLHADKGRAVAIRGGNRLVFCLWPCI